LLPKSFWLPDICCYIRNFKFYKNMHAYIFPGQGAQFPGMGKSLYENNSLAKEYFEQANEILGYRITDIMFNGTEDDLKKTVVTQPAIFLHSIVLYKTTSGLQPDAVAGHSLGEYTALVANNVLTFEDGLKLLNKRATAMMTACEVIPSTMAAVIGMDDEVVNNICKEVTAAHPADVVVAANYNCPGQLVISGTVNGVQMASEKLKAAGGRKILILPVGGAFHSPLMEPARAELAIAINNTRFGMPECPIYQNVDARAYSDPEKIKENLINQVTSPVLWTQTVLQMVADGCNHFSEVGPRNPLSGLVKKIDATVMIDGIS
jgi:[acyl-carrier-protein] S-malonyltransferase